MHNLNQSSQQPVQGALIPSMPGVSSIKDPYLIGRYFDQPAESDSDSGLLEYWRILLRYKKTIVLSAIGGMLLALLAGIPIKPTFRATTSLEVLNVNDDFMNMKQASPTTSTNDSYDISEEETQAKLLQGNVLLDRVFEKMDPGGVLTKKIPLASSGWRSWLHMSDKVEMTDRELLLSKAADSLKVVPTQRTRVLEVRADSKDPKLAADFVNTLVQEFIQQSLETRRNASSGTTDWLNKEISDARTRLHDSENALQMYASKSGLIFTDQEAETNVATEKLQQVQQELSTATGDRVVKQARLELAKSSPPDGLADVLQDESLQDARTKVDDMRRQVADLSAVYNPEYSKVQRAQAELTVLQSAYEGKRADLLKSIGNDYEQSRHRESLLTREYQNQAREVTGQDEKEIQYNILKRDVESNRQLYDMMLQQSKQAAIASAVRAGNVRVVDKADVPDSPVFPNYKIDSAVGILLGLLISVAWVILSERADRTLQKPGDGKLWTGLAELGTIPDIGIGMKSAYYGLPKDQVVQRTNTLANRSIKPRSLAKRPELITWEQKPSIAAEAFRSALTSIFFVGEAVTRPKVIVFTSAGPSDGKTTVVSNLAIATAEVRRKVLVIDADLRRPRMHNVFQVQNDQGLSDLLREEYSDERVATLIQDTDIPGVQVLPAGPATQSAVHLLYSPNFATLLERIKDSYDLILIDTPPMLHMTDARVVGRLTDAVVLVARAGQTTRDAVLSMKERFVEDNIRVLGTILNCWDPTRYSGSYYYDKQGPYYGRYSAQYGPLASSKTKAS